MTNERFRNLSIGLLLFAGVVMFLFQSNKGGNTLKLGSFISLGLLMLLAFISPVLGFLIALPVAVIVYFDHYNDVLTWIKKIQNATINKEG